MALVEIQDLSFQYEPDEPKILDQINLSIHTGEWLAIIGHNGSGKSTLAKMITGLIVPQSGKVVVDGLELGPDTVWEIRSKVGMVFQNPDNQFVGTTVEDDVAFGLENAGVAYDEMLQRVDEAIQRVGMSAFKTKEPARLSGGQKQRVALAGVIALTPQLIILDEATSMLDPLGRKEVIRTISELKKEHDLTVMSITHDIDEAALADRIILLNKGRILKEGPPSEIFESQSELIDHGLSLPNVERLKRLLIKKGVDIPNEYMTEERLLDYLWKLNL
ncbi:energy-coupling factor ABC transporter ATP-binding protein [Atopobacter phocae]|uniref:energy-coupling factor ABC transporter ATP-binding protein n=1 Tax=Atopobacter phocae TaxID=136492 RepID=UPI00046E8947|nr:energy-coupling factor ABC transporter ATP-binding protein [Atopobacter phocae]